VDRDLIPTAEIRPVAGTPFDFRKLTPIGRRIQTDNEQLRYAGGYDQNFVLNDPEHDLREAAFAVDPRSGRTLTVLTTQPGLQFYSGNFLNGSVRGYSGVRYRKHAGFCLETQHFPDSPNKPDFPSTILKPGQRMHSATVLVFGIAAP
jgi:aldose 1-epimerase